MVPAAMNPTVEVATTKADNLALDNSANDLPWLTFFVFSSFSLSSVGIDAATALVDDAVVVLDDEDRYCRFTWFHRFNDDTKAEWLVSRRDKSNTLRRDKTNAVDIVMLTCYFFSNTVFQFKRLFSVRVGQ